MFDFIVLCFSFFVNSFVSVVNVIVAILTQLYKITELYFLKNLLLLFYLKLCWCRLFIKSPVWYQLLFIVC